MSTSHKLGKRLVLVSVLALSYAVGCSGDEFSSGGVSRAGSSGSGNAAGFRETGGSASGSGGAGGSVPAGAGDGGASGATQGQGGSANGGAAGSESSAGSSGSPDAMAGRAGQVIAGAGTAGQFGISGNGGSSPPAGGSASGGNAGAGAAGAASTTGGAAGSGGATAAGGNDAMGGSVTAGGSDAAGGAATGGASHLACADSVVSPGGVAEPLSTIAEADDFQLSCASGFAPDVAYEFTAPAAGYYTITTVDSNFDTVLGVMAGDCSGEELACNDDFDSLPQSELVHRFDADERALLVVDGKAAASGDAILSIEPVTCPGQDLTGQPFPLTLTTVGGTNSQAGSCGGDGLRERALRWTAPSDGLYRFSVASDEITPALHLERGARCGGELLECLNLNPSNITRYLTEGEPVTLVVDSTQGEGSFDLDIAPVLGACPAMSEISYGTAVTLDPTAPDVLSGSCIPPFATTGTVPPFTEHSYPLHIELSGIAMLSFTIAAQGGFSVYLLRGTQCEGAEVFCQVATAGTNDWSTSFDFQAADNGDYILVIEAAHSVSYTINAWGVA